MSAMQPLADELQYGARTRVFAVAPLSGVARRAAVLPKIVVVPVFLGRIGPDLPFETIGPALDVRATVELPRMRRHAWCEAPSHRGADSLSTKSTPPIVGEVANTVPTVRIRGTCKNSFAKTIAIDCTLDLAGEINAAHG